MDFKTFRKLLDLAESKGYKPHINKNAYPALKLQDYLYLELCLCQKWLRDEHKIEVSPYYASEKSVGFHIKRISDGHVIGRNDSLKNSYESALLEGIHEALKLIS